LVDRKGKRMSEWQTVLDLPDGSQIDVIVEYDFYPPDPPSRHCDGHAATVDVYAVRHAESLGHVEGALWLPKMRDLERRTLEYESEQYEEARAADDDLRESAAMEEGRRW
jgi:hypothetical protein